MEMYDIYALIHTHTLYTLHAYDTSMATRSRLQWEKIRICMYVCICLYLYLYMYVYI
jgi:hypothetical protein